MTTIQPHPQPPAWKDEWDDEEPECTAHTTVPKTTLAELAEINRRLLLAYPKDFALKLNAKQLQTLQKEHDAKMDKSGQEKEG